MVYRLHEPKRHEPRRTAVDVATPVKLYIHNGATGNFAFPCWYQEIHPPVPAVLHNRNLHDHFGWPSPTRPDRSCQLWIPEEGHCIHGMQECHPHCRHYIDYKRVFPIHLSSLDEGYTAALVSWLDEHEGIEATASIDPIEDWVVRLYVDCQDINAIDEPQKYRLTVFVSAPEDTEHNLPPRRDIVALAELIVLPSAYRFEEIDNG